MCGLQPTFKGSIDEFESFIERKHLPIEKNEKGFETIASLYHKTTIKVPIQYHESKKFSFQKTKTNPKWKCVDLIRTAQKHIKS